MIRASLQTYFVPPHCRPKSKQTSPGASITLPTGSNFHRFCLKLPVACSGAVDAGRKIRRPTRATPPMGTLIQKHQRQDTFVVSAPPIRGPMIEEMPKTAPKSPWYLGRFRSGTRSIIVTDAPTNDPAPPMPVIALPMMNAKDDGAAAHNIDPTSKRATNTASVHFAE
jgi:hypothetical protein